MAERIDWQGMQNRIMEPKDLTTGQQGAAHYTTFRGEIREKLVALQGLYDGADYRATEDGFIVYTRAGGNTIYAFGEVFGASFDCRATDDEGGFTIEVEASGPEVAGRANNWVTDRLQEIELAE